MKAFAVLAATLVVTLMISLPSTGQFAKVGTSGVQFLEIGVGARPIGMGEAYTAVCDDATSIYWNPAGIARVEGKEILLGHTDWFADIRYESGAYAQNLGTVGNLGVFFSLLTMDEMNVTTPEQYEGNGETFTYQGVVGGVHYSKFFTDRFAFGANLKGVREDYGIESIAAQDWSVDVGTYYHTGFRSLRMGMSILHFGPDFRPRGTYEDYEDNREEPVRQDEEFRPYPLPMTFRVGLAMEVLESEPHAVTLAIDAVHPNDNVERVNLGAEYRFLDILFVRGGYKLRYDEEGPTAGVGFRWSLGGVALSVDYAFADFGRLPDVHRFSTGIAF